ncbi:hypothetical protein T484DRAFT_1804852, partial [Baffinella frigidus]
VPIPDKSTCYDFCWDRSKGKWLGWLETIPTFAIQPGAKFQDILVPTIDTVKPRPFDPETAPGGGSRPETAPVGGACL